MFDFIHTGVSDNNKEQTLCTVASLEKVKDQLFEHISTKYCLVVFFRIDNVQYETSSSDIYHPGNWTWVLQQKGRLLITLPYAFRSLSSGTLSHGIHERTVSIQGYQNPNLKRKETGLCIFHALSQLTYEVRKKAKAELKASLITEDDLLCHGHLLQKTVFTASQISGNILMRLQSHGIHKCHMPTISSLVTSENEWDEHSPHKFLKTSYSFAVIATFIVLSILLLTPNWIPGLLINEDELCRENQNVNQESHNQALHQNVIDAEGDLAHEINIFSLSSIENLQLIFPDWSSQSITITKQRMVVILYLLPWLLYLVYFFMYIGKVHNKLYGGLRRVGFDIFVILLYLFGAVIYYILNNRKTAMCKDCACVKFIISLPDKFEPIFRWKCIKTEQRTKDNSLYFTKAIALLMCSFLLSSVMWLLIEVLMLIIWGIIINTKFVDPSWVTIVAGCYYAWKVVLKFLDRYQRLFHNIYIIGNKIDNDEEINDRQKTIFRRQTGQFNISLHLLQNIIKEKLPLSDHVLEVMIKFFAVALFLLIVRCALIKVESEVSISIFAEYVVAIGSSFVVASEKLTGPSCDYQEKNKTLKELAILEHDLRHYVKSGKYLSIILSYIKNEFQTCQTSTNTLHSHTNP